jgi:transcriptional regulator with XRE-family HTH domain
MTPNQFRKRSGKLMKEARIAAGMTQEQAAITVKTNESMIDWIEKGEWELDFFDAFALARLYNVSVEYFVPLDRPLPEIKEPNWKPFLKRKPWELEGLTDMERTLLKNMFSNPGKTNLEKRAVKVTVKKHRPKPFLD